MSIKVNGTSIDSFKVNGKVMDDVYVNSSLIYQNVADLAVSGGRTLVLADFIKQNAPGKKRIVITLSGIVGPTSTGDLTGLDVTLISGGEIQGSRTHKNGLTLTSPIKLINNGWIRGAGGDGGRGGKGANDTFIKEVYDEKKDTWSTGVGSAYTWTFRDSTNINPQRYLISWDGNQVEKITNDITFAGPMGMAAVPGSTLLRGKYVTTISGKHFYNIIKKTRTTHLRIGGSGGAGGFGRSYGQARTGPRSGNASIPAGGNSGGTGGVAGDWGYAGQPGTLNGEPGHKAGYSIFGKGFLFAGSKIGHISGLII